MSMDSRSWVQVVEEDLYAEEMARFAQWVEDHPNPLSSLKAEIDHLHTFIESKGWCLPAGMPISECKDGICDCFLPDPQQDP